MGTIDNSEQCMCQVSSGKERAFLHFLIVGWQSQQEGSTTFLFNPLQNHLSAIPFKQFPETVRNRLQQMSLTTPELPHIHWAFLNGPFRGRNTAILDI
ncbi:hypothetical protein JTE90_006510 [Oedothorax gibbosus]|uniref:Uncharacterized protein n=1 Tax=Oedothorax gibbosus TaxID=931172 RepID=A0AAV6VNT3_9ARAC|nr:hypothetical protein JTE90_006510 [Oedothorax gibbosus]